MISPSSTETILVVDDCAGVCEVIEILLTRVGYRVLTATNGGDALEIARIVPEIDVLLSNLGMPEMRGDELAAHVATLHPSAAIVFLSSWQQPIDCASSSDFLLKPFTVAELRDSVRHALRTRPTLADAACAA